MLDYKNQAIMMMFLCVLLTIGGCTPNPRFFNTNQTSHHTEKNIRKKQEVKQQQKQPEAEPVESASEDAAPALKPDTQHAAETIQWDADTTVGVQNHKESLESLPPRKPTQQSIRLASRSDHTVRILLSANKKTAEIVASMTMSIHDGRKDPTVCSKLTIERSEQQWAKVLVDGSEKSEVAYPCTLICVNEFSVERVDGQSYRGSILLVPGSNGCSIINMLNVEDYLRGVVPLEVGKGSDEVIEAVKAQAVAARTYTYKKLLESAGGGQYDMLATVSDQVYGGVSAESEICNKAIRATTDEVIVYHDSLIYAYYHSTCGGNTANISDVWNKSSLPYLRSVRDGSEPFCATAGPIDWEELWTKDQFTFIVNKYSKEAFPQNPFHGRITSISLGSRFHCGRIKECRLSTTEGDFVYGGDKIRFAFRRNVSGYPILKSSCLTEAFVKGNTVVLRGKGYGHGVGMCQRGALGRAKSGAGYREILKAYYSDVEIKPLEINPQ